MTADVTVVMPAMNRAHMIGRALDSVWAQSLRPAAVIVIDDASTDDTVAVARAHGADVIALSVNGGSGPARNRGVEAAQTGWIAFLDSDDEWLPNHLERLVAREAGEVLLTSPAEVVGGGVAGNSASRDVRLTPRRALLCDLICTSGTIVRREVLLRAGLFRDLRRAQDMDMWIRVLELGTGSALSGTSVRYYRHDEQAVVNTDLMRACVEEIMATYRSRDWFRRLDRERVLATQRWDFARAAQYAGDFPEFGRHIGWLAMRPYTWAALGFNLRQRRMARASA